MKTIPGILLALWVSIPVGVAATQKVYPVGDRVRVVDTGGQETIGVLAAITDGEIRLSAVQSGGSPVISTSEVRMMERSIGVHRPIARNMAIGAAGGALLGGTVLAVTWSPCQETGLLGCLFEPRSRGEAFTWGMVGGAIVGLPLGLISGIRSGEEQWEPITLATPDDMRISLTPVIGARLGIRGSISFGR